MTGRTSWLAVVGLALTAMTAAPGAQAQEPTCQPQADVEGRASPYDSVSMTVGTGMVKVCYSRPSLRGRTMIGGEAVPYGKLWRTGANEPTTLHTSVPLSIAGIEVGPGSYSLYTIPREDEDWTLIVNASTSQWGHEGQYPGVKDQDVGRTEVAAEPTDGTVEQFTIRPAEDGSGLVLEWQNSRVHVPITAG